MRLIMTKKYIFIKSIVILLIIVLLQSINSFAQTSSHGNYRIYTAETSTSSFGYLNSTVTFPEQTGIGSLSLSGFLYSYNYLFSNLTSIALSNDEQLKFYMEGTFRIGAAVGSKKLSFIPETFKSEKLTYYFATLDLFSLDFTPEYTYVFNHGEAITFKIGINFLNIGGSGALLKDGKFDKHSVIELNFLPFALKPTLFYDFGKTGVGISYFINSANILSYLIAHKQLFGSDRGVTALSKQFTRHSFQIVFVF